MFFNGSCYVAVQPLARVAQPSTGEPWGEPVALVQAEEQPFMLMHIVATRAVTR